MRSFDFVETAVQRAGDAVTKGFVMTRFVCVTMGVMWGQVDGVGTL